MTLEIVIISFNTSKMLQDCLTSLFDCLKKENLQNITQVTVVDNASSDNSVQMVKKNFPKVKIIENKNNTGFAKANNQAIRISNADYIFLLNSDTIVLEGALTQLISKISNEKTITVLGPKLLNPDHSLQQSFGFFPTITRVFCWMLFIDDLPWVSRVIKAYHIQEKSWYVKDEEVDWVSGASLLVSRDIIKKAGVLDENIFMYGEEVEWCYRIKKQGGKIIFTPNAQIIHLRGGSQKKPGANIIREYESIIYFYKKYYPNLDLFVRLLLKTGALLRLLLFGIISRDQSKIALYVKAFKVA